MIEELLPFLFPIWQQHHGLLVQNPDQITDELIEKAVLVLKVIRKSVVHGLRKPSENDNIPYDTEENSVRCTVVSAKLHRLYQTVPNKFSAKKNTREINKKLFFHLKIKRVIGFSSWFSDTF